MQVLFAIAMLTIKAAVRFRLLVVLGVLLLLSVVALPLIIKDDGTAQGLTQILITYTLSFITALLGLATMWIACGTLARDIEEYQIQMIATKPVARWQIWLGKWLGIMAFNAVLLIVSGAAVFFMMQKRSQNLPDAQQSILRESIFVARQSARMPVPKDEIDASVNDQIAVLLKRNPEIAHWDHNEFKELRKKIEQEIIAPKQVVRPGKRRRWQISVAPPDELKDRPLYLRIKFFTNSAYDTRSYLAFWEIGPPEGFQRVRIQNSISPEAPIEFQIPPNLLDAEGNLTIDFENWNEKALLFPLEDGLEVLYKQGNFGANFIRGMILIYCWLGFLCALGLMAASLLSFPIAAFFTLATLFIGFSTGTLSQIIEEEGIIGMNTNTGKMKPTWINKAAVMGANGLLGAIQLVQDFSPIDSLSTGRRIGWKQVARGIFQIVIGMGGLLGLIGVILLSKRELANAKSF